MNEAQVVRRLVAALKVRLPGAVIFKHADMVTAGIPDISVTWRGKVDWLEVKYLKAGETIFTARRKFDKRQLVQCERLEAQGACRYVVAYQGHDGLVLRVLRPSQVRAAIDGDSSKLPYYDTFEVAVTKLVPGGQDG